MAAPALRSTGDDNESELEYGGPATSTVSSGVSVRRFSHSSDASGRGLGPSDGSSGPVLAAAPRLATSVPTAAPTSNLTGVTPGAHPLPPPAPPQPQQLRQQPQEGVGVGVEEGLRPGHRRRRRPTAVVEPVDEDPWLHGSLGVPGGDAQSWTFASFDSRMGGGGGGGVGGGGGGGGVGVLSGLGRATSGWITVTGGATSAVEGRTTAAFASGTGDPLLWDSSMGHALASRATALRKWHMWEGRATFLCGGRVMLGPDVGNVGVTCAMLAVPFVLVIFLMYVRAWW